MQQKVLSSKEIILSILAGGLTVLSLWLWHKAIPVIIAGEFENYASLVGTVTSLLFAGAVFAFAAMFVEKQKLLYLCLIAGVSVPFLLVPASVSTLIVFAVSATLLVFAAYRIKKEYALALGFSLSKLFRAGMPLYFTVISLVIANFYLTQLDEEKAISALLPKSTMNFLLNRFGQPISQLTGLPQIRAEATVDEILVELIKQQADAQGISIKELSSREVSLAVGAQRQEIEQSYGIKLKGKEKVSDVFYNAINERVADLLGPYNAYIPYVSATTFFFAFKALTLPLYYVTILFLSLLIKLLVVARFLKLEKKQIEVERLTL